MIATTTSIMLSDPRFGGLPDSEKSHVLARLSMMQRIDSASNKQAAFNAESRRPHARRFYSEGSIRKMYYEKWVGGGRSWIQLINRSRVPGEAATLPKAAVEHWHMLCYQFRGKHLAAHRKLQRDWEAGSKIPGFEDAPWAPELPRGLSYDNLMRPKNRPTAVLDRVAAIGISAAADLMPGVLSTRVGLQFGAKFVFDDMWHDFKVNVPGETGARRLLQFHCLELLSACQCARGMKPEILNDRTGRFERLKERELLFLLAHVLGNIGYNPEGCELMMEHGTASVAGEKEKLLHEISGGKITFGRGSISGSPLAAGLYAGRGKGNFRFKAALESLGNLIHNETADRVALPAQTGSNARLNEPEELHGRLKHHDALVLAMLALPPALRELVRLPVTPLIQAIEFADMVQERVNDRRVHEIEGWAQCGFIMSEYRLRPNHPWSPMTELREMADALRAAAEQAISEDPRLSRQRNLSPREVFTVLRPGLTTLRAHHIPMIIGMENAAERRVAKDGRFTFEDQDLGPGDHVYGSVAHTEDGQAIPLQKGEKFASFVSTLDPLKLHVCDARGGYIGWCDREIIHTRGDAAGYARAAGRKMQAHHELLAPVLAAARPIMKRMTDDAAVNDVILAEAEGASTPRPEKPSTHERHVNRRRADQLARAAQEKLDQAI